VLRVHHWVLLIVSAFQHPNIVRFFKYWMDSRGKNQRVVFITEYMTSGSLKNFIKLAQKNKTKVVMKVRL
jgi:serine/threonine protein kinase